MAALYEIREKIILLYRQYENIIMPIIKFLAVMAGLLYINSKIGYMSTINSILPVLIAALICSLASAGLASCVYAVFILLHLYALSLEAAAVGAVIMLILILLYFRFSPKDSMLIVLFPAACAIGAPYALVLAGGLLYGPYAALTCASCFIIKEVCAVAAENETALTGSADAAEMLDRFRLVVDAVMGNRRMIVLVMASILAVLIVYMIRRLAIKQSWYIAVAAGTLVQFITILAGGAKMSVAGLFGGMILSALIGVVITFMVFNLDYSAIENAQFEDDEYYYYVKAVPKISLSSGYGNTGVKSAPKKSHASYDTDNHRTDSRHDDEYDNYDGEYDYDYEEYEPLADDYYEEQ